MKGNRLLLNSILTVIALFLLGVAVRITWLPPVASKPTISQNKTEKELNENVSDSLTFISPTSQDSIAERPKDMIVSSPYPSSDPSEPAEVPRPVRSVKLRNRPPEKMVGSHPFRAEAEKVLAGGLRVEDSIRRRTILNYCEHFRMAYDTKDLDFLRQIFSEDALIIVGNTVKSGKGRVSGNAKVRYTVHSRRSYLERLSEIFTKNKKIKVDFSDFHILRHPTMEGIYGVSLRQKYASDIYSDEGQVFLLWDFRNESMPLIHVRTWQPLSAINNDNDLIEISDFNLE